ncbi:MAG: DNA polymerase III subunit beta [Elusimicrobia bacterium]|nr:DNA polymerase III subunit beta [Elusimicrobiota bacterium]
MKIKVDKKELTDRLQIVQNTVSRKSTLPILSNYLLETERKNKKLWITSTDLEVGIRSSIDAEIEHDGAITLPAKKLGEILHELPAAEESSVVLELRENNRVQVVGSHARFQITGIPRDDYPLLPEFREDSSIEFPPALLLEMIRKTIFAASSDETRYVLNGALFIISKGTATLVATDGRRLATVSESGISESVDVRAIVPAKAFVEAGRIISHFQEGSVPATPILIEISENRAGFKIGATTLFSRLIEGNFPAWEQVVPQKTGWCVRVDRERLLAVTKRASLCIADRVGTCRYRFFKDHCQITSKTLDRYEFDEDLSSIQYDGEDGFEVALNPAHIIEFLKNVGSDQIEIFMTTGVNPLLLTAPDKPGYSYVVMPTRV